VLIAVSSGWITRSVASGARRIPDVRAFRQKPGV